MRHMPVHAGCEAGGARIPSSRIAAVLFGFPAVSALLSLLLLQRGSLEWTGLGFFTAFWWLITGWYVLQIVVLSRGLRESGWTWCDIRVLAGKRETAGLIAGYMIAGALRDPEGRAEPSPLIGKSEKSVAAAYM